MQSYLARKKIFAHPERLAEWITYGITKPITAEIDPSNRCNYKCPKCAGNRSDPQAELSLYDMNSIVDEVSGFLKGLVFTEGGEPLINRNTPEAIRYARSKGIDIGLITNGSLFDRLDREQILSDCSWIRISLDGLYPGHYAARMGTSEDEYSRVWDNVVSLAKTRSKKGLDCVIGIAYLTEDENADQLMGFALRGKEAGADYVEFRPFHHSETNLLGSIKECKSLNSKNFEVIAPEEKYRKEKFDYERAFADEFRFVIAANGKLYPCCYTRGFEQFSFGNIMEEGFEYIWKSEKRREVAENKLKNKICPSMCYEDPQNQSLWEIHKANKEGKHVNFI
jgi:radical SAM protein with 4Fe4S-binding SPASM domain